jgi:hypothetical protein
VGATVAISGVTDAIGSGVAVNCMVGSSVEVEEIGRGLKVGNIGVEATAHAIDKASKNINARKTGWIDFFMNLVSSL